MSYGWKIGILLEIENSVLGYIFVIYALYAYHVMSSEAEQLF